MRLAALVKCGTIAALFALASTASVVAGTISLAWDPVAGATSYQVHYGTSSANYTQITNVNTNSATLNNLQDCTTWYIAVKASNSSGVSENFSTEVSGWPRPVLTSATPSSTMQGQQAVVDIYGNNFQSGAEVDLGADSHVNLGSTSVVSCTHIQVLATVEPTAPNVRPAQVGRLDIAVVNPDDVFGVKAQAFEVLINPARFDVNRTDTATRDRIDGKDTIYLSRVFGLSEANANYDPDNDFDGDGWVDGTDLAYIASNLGRCWSSASGSWSAAACPAGLR